MQPSWTSVHPTLHQPLAGEVELDHGPILLVNFDLDPLLRSYRLPEPSVQNDLSLISVNVAPIAVFVLVEDELAVHASNLAD
eukprot:scaffold84_cov388-Prasinococcus_capsulatus_cf.AAC.12